jgi:hypothetical protein
MRRFAFAMLVSTGAMLAAVACGGSNDNGGLFDTSGSASDSGGGSTADARGNVNGNDAGNGNNNGTDSGNGGNNGNDSGNGGNGNDAGNNGMDSGQSTGTPCTVGSDGVSNDCNMGEACISPNCATGFCQKVVTGSSDFKPVCGCDKVSYWNIGLGADNIAGIKGSGACSSSGAAQCSGLSPLAKCSVAGINASCGFPATNIGGNQCSPATNGVCWVLPSTCPTATSGAAGVTSCGPGNTCVTLCDAISKQTSYLQMPACTLK